MGLFANPLSHAGYPPNVTGTPETQPSEVRTATIVEAEAGILDYVYISPATLSAAASADFASPPVLGFGSTTPRPVHATTLSAVGATTINTSGAATTSIGSGGTGAVNIGNTTGNTTVTGTLNTAAIAGTSETLTTGAASSAIGLAIDTSAGTGVGETIKTTAITTDALQLVNGGIKVTVSQPSPGASPITCNNRFGVCTFTGASIAAGATQDFVVSNSIVTNSSVVLVSLVGGTTGAALSIQSATSGTGSITFTVQNGTGATTSTANLSFVFWVFN